MNGPYTRTRQIPHPNNPDAFQPLNIQGEFEGATASAIHWTVRVFDPNDDNRLRAWCKVKQWKSGEIIAYGPHGGMDLNMAVEHIRLTKDDK